MVPIIGKIQASQIMSTLRNGNLTQLCKNGELSTERLISKEFICV